MNADEEACLRSLSFTEIYARENIIEPAIQDTGSWLLESQNFQDWVQRKRLDKHRGFFWIQGNPGSGKSTLIKKIYSHITTCPQDPSSVIAAFFFNARGNQIEKSPTGLFRTLLHTLCQRISALRDLVVKSYVKNRRLLSSGWQWQLSELKDFLAAVVTSPVLGQRSLLLFVDALDECDLAATQSVIDMFEDLAHSSLSEGSNFSICVSSRYWPQFRIPHCFIARVELENKADIVRYIQKRLESTQMNENLGLHAALRAEILDKAKGTFLWVVLVTRDLLQANTAGATLRELRDIVRTVPPGLSEFYQHQLQSTEGEDRGRMLRLLQLVFYAQRPLSPTELRYALAFGCRAYASYAEWSQSSEFVSSNEQMAKRIRGHSKGLVEIAQSPEQGFEVVQLIHQSVRDFLTADGFSFLRESGRTTQSAEGHEFLKTACLNYLTVKDLEIMSELEFKVDEQFWDRQRQMPNLVVDHPLLDYVVLYIFPHAAQAEQLGIAQDSFRTYMCGNIQGCFERWRYFHDMLKTRGGQYPQGPGARPIHVLAQYGLLTNEIAEKERNINIEGGAFGSALVAACWRGHQDAVEILLQFGADSRFDASYRSGLHNWILGKWDTSMTPLFCAVYNQDLPVLRQLLNDPRSSFTLQERLRCSNRFWIEKPHLEAFLALLFPEATFPESAIDDLCEALGKSNLGVFSFLLNRSNDSIVHEEMLWHWVFSSSSNKCMSKTRALLDRGGRVEITDALVDCLNEDQPHQSAGRVLSLLLEQDFEVEMTEDLVDSISQFENSSQIVRTFEAKGYQFDPFTPKQLLCALRSGSAETAAFFLQHQDGKSSADEMLQSALSNESNGEEVARLLLGYLNPDHIDEQAIIAALANSWCGDDLFKLLHSRWSSLTFSEAALASAVSTQDLDIIKTVLDNCECVRITERILTEATLRDRDFRDSAADVLELLLLHDPDVNISESSVIGAIRNFNQGIEIFDVLRRHRKSLLCTEEIVAAAAKSSHGPDALDIVLHQDRGAKISSSMIMTAMRANGTGAALISVMLQHDHTIVVNEEHLVAAASNPCGPSTIFAFLQMKGKLGKASPASEGVNTGPAKRRKISQNSSPRISTEVINAAFSNPMEGARLQLLELFMEWGIITEADCNHRLYNDHARFTIPSILQLSPGT